MVDGSEFPLMKKPGQVITVLCAVLVALCTSANARAEPADEWFDDDLEERIARVNDGELQFMTLPPAEPVHHHRNVLILDETSLNDGWVRLQQCHEHLDAVPRAQIVFREDRLRHLSITHRRNISRAWVSGASVQLEGVQQRAKLCLEAQSRVLRRNEDGSYGVRNGPYMRRFLDGYYPMRVSVELRYPCGRLQLTGSSPRRQQGFTVTETACGVSVDAWFQGRLVTDLRFVER